MDIESLERNNDRSIDALSDRIGLLKQVSSQETLLMSCPVPALLCRCGAMGCSLKQLETHM